jgi:hypothetical protein
MHGIENRSVHELSSVQGCSTTGRDIVRGWHLPERALGVKWVSRYFFIFFFGEAGKGFVSGGLRFFRSDYSWKVRGGSRVVAVFLFEVVEPFFSLRLHPNTSLRESDCLKSAVVRAYVARHDTEYSAATVSHCYAVSIRFTLGISPSPRVGESRNYTVLSYQEPALS